MTSGFDTTSDAFLGGRLTLKQPVEGYRAGVDPVLLASAVKARAGQSVLELGCGAGAAMLCLGTRVNGLSLHGVELQAPYADLCRANAADNQIDATVWSSDLRSLPADLKEMSFDHVIMNPPYLFQPRYRMDTSGGRGIAFAGDTPLDDWLDVAFRRLAPKGWLTMIQKMDRLPDVLRAMDTRLGAITVYPITARIGRAADRFILQARKHGMTPFVMTAPVILHQGAVHTTDGDDYTAPIAAVLRNGAAFPFPD